MKERANNSDAEGRQRLADEAIREGFARLKLDRTDVRQQLLSLRHLRPRPLRLMIDSAPHSCLRTNDA